MSTEAKTFYVQLHDGGGSMSECARHSAMFGPYTQEEAEAVCEKLDANGVCNGYDSGMHSSIIDVELASLDVDAFCEKWLKENA